MPAALYSSAHSCTRCLNRTLDGRPFSVTYATRARAHSSPPPHYHNHTVSPSPSRVSPFHSSVFFFIIILHTPYGHHHNNINITVSPTRVADILLLLFGWYINTFRLISFSFYFHVPSLSVRPETIGTGTYTFFINSVIYYYYFDYRTRARTYTRALVRYGARAALSLF